MTEIYMESLFGKEPNRRVAGDSSFQCHRLESRQLWNWVRLRRPRSGTEGRMQETAQQLRSLASLAETWV